MTEEQIVVQRAHEREDILASLDLSAGWSRSFDRDFFTAAALYMVLWSGLLVIGVVSGDLSIALVPLGFSVFGGAVLYFGAKVYAWHEHRSKLAGKTNELRQDSRFFTITAVFMAAIVLVAITAIILWVSAHPVG